MQVTVNGQAQDVSPGTTMTALIHDLGLAVGSVVVEHNGTALLKSEVLTAAVADGDVIELVRAVAGG